MWEHVIAVRDMRDPRIDSKAKAVLMNLASRIGRNEECWPSVGLIAEDCCMSAKGVQRAIKQLSTLGYIAVLSGKARGLPNRYCLAESIASDTGEVVNKDMKSFNKVGRSDRGGRTNEVGQAGRSGETTTPPRSDTLTEVNENLKGEKTKVEVSKSVATNTPTMSQAIRAAYAHGASMEEAKRFWRFNQLRDWKALAKMPLDFLAEEWVDKWIKKNPRDFEAEHSRRRLEAKRREEAERERLLAEARARGEIP